MLNEQSTLNYLSSSEHISDDIKFIIACCQINPSEDDIEFIHSYLSHLALNADTPVVKTKEGCITNYKCLDKKCPWGALITTSMQHGILPVVYKTIKTLSQNDNLNAEILTELKAHYMNISQRNMLMSAELIQIMNKLKENDIQALAFKGPTLSQMAYDDITLRQYGDLDILIQKKDRSKMLNILNKEHYIPEINLKEKTKETFFDSVNVIGFYNPSTGVRIEMHWELLSKNYAIDWEEEDLWNKQNYILINQKNVPVLRLEQLLLYLCVHGGKHLFERLEWVCDIDRSIRENPNIDWKHLLHEAEKLGIKRMLFLGLNLSQQFFRLELPHTIREQIAQDKVLEELISQVIDMNFSKTSQQKRSYSTFGLLLNMREKISDKLQFSWRALFSPKFDDFLFIQLPRPLAFFYPLVRPFRLVTKYFKH